MSIKFISKLPPSDRRSLPVATGSTILPGQVAEEDANGDLVLADGASIVESPKWAFTASSRVDAAEAEAMTVVEGPFTADVNTDGYVGTPVKGNAFEVGTGGNVGKLVVLTVTADATTLQSIVAYCERAPDADGFIRIRVIR